MDFFNQNLDLLPARLEELAIDEDQDFMNKVAALEKRVPVAMLRLNMEKLSFKKREAKSRDAVIKAAALALFLNPNDRHCCFISRSESNRCSSHRVIGSGFCEKHHTKVPKEHPCYVVAMKMKSNLKEAARAAVEHMAAQAEDPALPMDGVRRARRA